MYLTSRVLTRVIVTLIFFRIIIQSLFVIKNGFHVQKKKRGLLRCAAGRPAEAKIHGVVGAGPQA